LITNGGSLTERATLSEKETRLIRMLRTVRFGKIEIEMQDGQPYKVVEIKNSVKL